MSFQTLFKKPFFGRFQKPWRWPEGIDRAAWSPARFDSGRRGTLAGLYGEALGGPAKGSIVCVPPLRLDSKSFYLKTGLAQMLRMHGYHVLLMDLNGFGESEDIDLRYPLDVLAAGRALRELTPGLPMGLLGISFGATWATCALAVPGHGFEAAVLESGFTTLEEYWHQYPAANVTLKVLKALRPRLISDLQSIDQMSKVRELQEVLLIYAGKDNMSPPSMGERFRAACPLPEERRTLWVVPEAEHAKVWQTVPDEYRQRVLGVFDRQLAAKAMPKKSA
jgi:alpha/beta superfamily hydrolase